MTRFFAPILLASALSLIACKDRPLKVKDVVLEDIKPDSTLSITREKLTERLIDDTPDEDLVDIIIYHTETAVPEDAAKDLSTASPRNKSRQAIYLTWLVEIEVDNGGFNQFYYNQRQLTFKNLPEAFKIIGAERYAGLMQKANETYEKNYQQITKSQDGTLEGFSKSYENNPLTPLDHIFYDLADTENLGKLQVQYIRAHKPDFVDQ